MPSVPDETSLPLESYRRYLRVIAQTQLDPRWQAKVDLSGIVQLTLMEAHQAADQLRAKTEGQRLAWLRRIFANNVTDEFRKWFTEARDVRREMSIEQRLAESSQHLVGWLANDDPTASTKLSNEERLLRIVNALHDLPDTQREALMLQHWHGWSLAQIAEHMGKTTTAVAGLLKRGLQQLREVLRSDNEI